jgi:phosphate:Na+ symporter
MCNVINTVLFIGFTTWFACLAERLVPERAPEEGVIVRPEFLDEAAITASPMALQQVRLELGRVGDIVRRDDQVDVLEEEILSYLRKLRKGSLTEQESMKFQGLMTATDNLESLADVIETDLSSLARKAAQLGAAAGQETQAMLQELYVTVLKAVELTVQALRDKDQRAAESVIMLKDRVREQSDRLLSRKAERLTADDPDYLTVVRLQMAFVDHMRRIYTLAKRITIDVLPPALAKLE